MLSGGKVGPSRSTGAEGTSPAAALGPEPERGSALAAPTGMAKTAIAAPARNNIFISVVVLCEPRMISRLILAAHNEKPGPSVSTGLLL